MTRFWAKTGAAGQWLSLDRHLDDVAAVAERLWDVALTARQRAWVARACDVDESTMRAWWVFLAGVHDIGKANPAFQGLVPDLARRVVDHDVSLASPTGAPIRHDQVSGAILAHAWGPAWAPCVSRGTWEYLAAVISGHHGVLRSRKDLRDAERRVVAPFSEWHDDQRAILDRRAEQLGLRAEAVPRPSRAVVLALAGLLTVADWIGSDQTRFAVTSDAERPSSRDAAVLAVARAVWGAPAVVPDRVFGYVFVDQTGAARSPRASQRAVIDALERRDRPCLLLVEDRTGSGKTESALWAAYRGLQNGARGLYIGMPTRATANQLHQRTEAFLARVLDHEDPRARLLHSGIEAADAATGDGPTPTAVGSDGDRAAREAVDARAWFLDRRRGLLERFGVGTIDQALLAVLEARHFAVRLWGLQGKVVIFDEVHAYEAYTAGLLDRTVAWLAALDCTVVLLSATLPSARRAELVTAFRAGRMSAQGVAPGRRLRVDSPLVGTASYPRLTVADHDRADVIAIDDPREPRTFAVDRLELPERDDGAAVAERVADAVSRGGCVAVVCNTVALAQRRFEAVREHLDDDIEVLLLHARLRPVEREPLERRLMAMLGPDARRASGRPDRLVVVATQVIEQSLDVDFDLMLSDIAPIDLLIQRAGRVHRHQRCDERGRSERPEAHRAARLVVLDTAGRRLTRPYVRGNDRVYAPPVLHRTRHVLADCQTITEPTDLDRMIASVYPAKPDADELRLPVEDAAALRRADQEFADELRERRSHADRVLVSDPGAEDPPWEHAQAPLADDEAPGATVHNGASTRWITQPTVGVVVLGAGELDDLRKTPSAEDARELLRRAVSLRVGQLGVPIRRRPRGPGLDVPWQPPGWREHPLLRHHLLVRTDRTGWAQPPEHAPDEDPLPVYWRPVDGVTIRRPTKEPTCAST